ncbi:MAG: C1 family peptidase [Bacteroidaceae bacterium]|nr:C1 family peptidase [Bacteroidaceae bacterium]
MKTMIKNRLYILALMMVASISVNAQRQQGLGCVYKSEVDGKVPLRPQLMTRDYMVLPKAYSLKKYCPTPKSQGPHGTCTAWSTTYAARTMCEAISNGWTNKDTITKEAFSPIFIYKQLNREPECQNGTSIAEALWLLKSKGAPKLRSFDVLCADYIPNNLYTEASNYKIDDYTALFNIFSGYVPDKISSVKKALAENHPVVIAMDVCESFDIYNGGDLWNGVKGVDCGGHAMCVIGYDDDKYGGAFEIMNSWGTWWADSGYVWIKYEDFRESVYYAYDIYW